MKNPVHMNHIEVLNHIGQLKQRIEQLERGVKPLVDFIDGCFETVFEGFSYDGGDMQDALTELGILELTTYDPEKHGECEHGSEKGDDWYIVADWFKQLRKEGEL